jgi:hypothetical protein
VSGERLERGAGRVGRLEPNHVHPRSLLSAEQIAADEAILLPQESRL